MSNKFSFPSKCEKSKIETLEEDAKLIKTCLGQKILTIIPDDKKSDYKYEDENGNQLYKCPNCHKSGLSCLHNSHVGVTRKNMLDDILKNHVNDPKNLSEYWNMFLDMHKFIEIAVCCDKCNKTYECSPEDKIEQLKVIKKRIYISSISKSLLNEAFEKKGLIKTLSDSNSDTDSENDSDNDSKELLNKIEFQKFKKDNLDDKIFYLILTAYESNGKDKNNITQIRSYKKNYKLINKYIDDDKFFEHILDKSINNQDTIDILNKSREKLSKSFTKENNDRKRNEIDEHRFPNAIFGTLITYFKSQ